MRHSRSIARNKISFGYYILSYSYHYDSCMNKQSFDYIRFKAISIMNENILLGLFGITDIMDLPAAVNRLLFSDKEKRDAVYRSLIELNEYDMSYDWFQTIYEKEMAQRKKNKQDFTPREVTTIVSRITLCGTCGSIHEPTAGTGSLVISAWWERCRRVLPWEYFPSENMVTCWELSDRAIPLLLLNMSIRGMMGYVYHGDVLEGRIFQKYILLNKSDDGLGFSDVFKANPKDTIRRNWQLIK